MRGEDHTALGGTQMRVGNTPTCVGKTRPAFVVTVRNWKHPHMRGEDGKSRSTGTGASETPPHAWGRRGVFPPRGIVQRNTPTCVGKTRDALHFKRRAGKHPHMRGEDRVVVAGHGQAPETPPHAWGRRRTPRLACVLPGNTPTCVGKTANARTGPLFLKKHPHMRGEDPERSLNFFLHTWY